MSAAVVVILSTSHTGVIWRGVQQHQTTRTNSNNIRPNAIIANILPMRVTQIPSLDQFNCLIIRTAKRSIFGVRLNIYGA